MNVSEWVRVGPGELELNTWISDSHVTYSAVWETAGWTLTRRVAGASSALTMATGERNFDVLEKIVADDKNRGL